MLLRRHEVCGDCNRKILKKKWERDKIVQRHVVAANDIKLWWGNIIIIMVRCRRELMLYICYNIEN